MGNDPLNGVDPIGLYGLWGSDTCWSAVVSSLASGVLGAASAASLGAAAVDLSTQIVPCASHTALGGGPVLMSPGATPPPAPQPGPPPPPPAPLPPAPTAERCIGPMIATAGWAAFAGDIEAALVLSEGAAAFAPETEPVLLAIHAVLLGGLLIGVGAIAVGCGHSLGAE